MNHAIANESFGGCPECGGWDAYVRVGQCNWFRCSAHLTAWRAGAPLPSDQAEQSGEEQRRTWDASGMGDYTVVDPICPPVEDPAEQHMVDDTGTEADAPGKMNKVWVRLATAADGDRIGELVRGGGFEIEGIDWRLTGGNVIVVEVRRKVVGMIQVCPALPVGWLGFLCVDTGLRKRNRARAAGALVVQALATLRQYGSQAAVNVVGIDDKAFVKILKNRGATMMVAGSVFLKMLPTVSRRVPPVK